jgi:hypothetical protein
VTPRRRRRLGERVRLRQLRRRVAARFGPLGDEELRDFARHRCVGRQQRCDRRRRRRRRCADELKLLRRRVVPEHGDNDDDEHNQRDDAGDDAADHGIVWRRLRALKLAREHPRNGRRRRRRRCRRRLGCDRNVERTRAARRFNAAGLVSRRRSRWRTDDGSRFNNGYCRCIRVTASDDRRHRSSDSRWRFGCCWRSRRRRLARGRRRHCGTICERQLCQQKEKQ